MRNEIEKDNYLQGGARKRTHDFIHVSRLSSLSFKVSTIANHVAVNSIL